MVTLTYTIPMPVVLFLLGMLTGIILIFAFYVSRIIYDYYS